MELITSDQVSRLKRVRQHVQSLDFQAVSVIGTHKFSGRSFQYSLEGVEPPDKLYFRGNDRQALDAELAVSFGGTVSPTADGFQMGVLLAQATIDNACGLRAAVVAGGVLGIDMASHMGALDRNWQTIAVVANSVLDGALQVGFGGRVLRSCMISFKTCSKGPSTQEDPCTNY